MSDAVLSTAPNPNELRSELESMVIGDLLGLDDGQDGCAGVRRQPTPRTHHPGQFGFESHIGCHD